MLFASSSQAKLVCDKLDANYPGEKYQIGGSLYIGDVPVEVGYLVGINGERSDNGANFVEISSSRHAGDDGIELHVNNAAIKFKPEQAPKRITMSVAQNTGDDNSKLLSNIEINGERIQLIHGLSSSRGFVLGDNAKGQVLVDADIADPPAGQVAQWINGSITFIAKSGAIETLTVGGLQINVDDICFIY